MSLAQHVRSYAHSPSNAGAVDEKKVRDMADALVDRGFAEAGYTYLNIDGEHLASASRSKQQHAASVCLQYGGFDFLSSNSCMHERSLVQQDISPALMSICSWAAAMVFMHERWSWERSPCSLSPWFKTDNYAHSAEAYTAQTLGRGRRGQMRAFCWRIPTASRPASRTCRTTSTSKVRCFDKQATRRGMQTSGYFLATVICELHLGIL